MSGPLNCTALADMWSAAWLLGVRQPELAQVHDIALNLHLRNPAMNPREHFGFC